jgi:6-pyruvoyltetrahydropterin/6-carboxytetrahydropterin synthase
MYTIGVQRSFRATHFLVGSFGQEELTPHSHPYLVEWRIGVPTLDSNGFGVDIALMERLLEELLTKYDSVLLNDLPFFAQRQSSLEHVCLFFWQELAKTPAAGGAATQMTLRIWENDHAWAELEQPLG